MAFYGNFSIAAWIYLALHGNYGMLWLLKDRLALAGMGVLSLYWVAPLLLIASGVEPPAALIAAAISLNILGVFLHYASDAQKHFTLKYKSGLITEGFFARCRNTNYLGEILIYFSFAMLAMHWLPYAILAGFALLLFLPNMRNKDASLSRYPEFEAYRQHSGLLLPRLLP